MPSSEVAERMAAATYAYPQPSEAARAERDENVDRLVASGPGGEQWRAYFQSLEEEWLRMDNQAGIGAELSAWECHKLGCFATVTCSSVEDIERFNVLARRSPGVRGWAGPGFVSGPIRNEAGEIEVTWMFVAP